MPGHDSVHPHGRAGPIGDGGDQADELAHLGDPQSEMVQRRLSDRAPETLEQLLRRCYRTEDPEVGYFEITSRLVRFA